MSFSSRPAFHRPLGLPPERATLQEAVFELGMSRQEFYDEYLPKIPGKKGAEQDRVQAIVLKSERLLDIRRWGLGKFAPLHLCRVAVQAESEARRARRFGDLRSASAHKATLVLVEGAGVTTPA